MRPNNNEPPRIPPLNHFYMAYTLELVPNYAVDGVFGTSIVLAPCVYYTK
jgi:hypothetical protein